MHNHRQNNNMEPEIKKKTLLTSNRIIAVMAVLLILVGSSAYYFYKKATFDPQKQAQKELEIALESVGRHIMLPKDEIPSLATISDPAQLKGQAFFVNAQKGDQVLIFPTSKKAILYSPSLDKLIEVAPVNLGDAAQQ